MFSLNVIKLVQINTYCYENMNQTLVKFANLRLTVAAHLRVPLENFLLHQKNILAKEYVLYSPNLSIVREIGCCKKIHANVIIICLNL